MMEYWNETGVMEKWNVGMMGLRSLHNIPLFHLHAYFPPFSFKAASTFSGVMGSSLILTPTAS
jgi:hypothetical protein